MGTTKVRSWDSAERLKTEEEMLLVAALHEQVRDAVRCHFVPDRKPSPIRLHITREEALAA